ncbi:universal stress protein [Caldichromatium japonicum]|uniref:Universal stress protein n=1 Tax=Caldichromatium japonicum TaxID=2699430 RepID=A0A6G7VFQ3_9GAMM|nr:universal stress protein [Caldichromatium japonicum]QIK38706.1 universal stress protein [Caldichromatium japonicum]
MYRNILVAVDGSHTSEIALQEAIKLARAFNGKLMIVHAVEMVNINFDSEFPVPNEIWEAMRKSGETVLAKAQAAAREAGIAAETRLLEIDTLGRRIPEAIADAAQSWPADVIVIGTHGRRGISHLFLGSVAEGVVRVASTPCC